MVFAGEPLFPRGIIPLVSPHGLTPYHPPERGRSVSLESALAAVPMLLVVWALLTALFVGLLTYRGQLTRYEDEQLFLTDNNPDEQRRQSHIVRRIKQVQPFVNVLGGAAALFTVGIVGIWVADAIRVLR